MKSLITRSMLVLLTGLSLSFTGLNTALASHGTVTENVRERLMEDLGTRSVPVVVEMQGDTATIRGEARDRDELREVEQVVRGTPGVSSIRNEMIVTDPPSNS